MPGALSPAEADTSGASRTKSWSRSTPKSDCPRIPSLASRWQQRKEMIDVNQYAARWLQLHNFLEAQQLDWNILSLIGTSTSKHHSTLSSEPLRGSGVKLFHWWNIARTMNNCPMKKAVLTSTVQRASMCIAHCEVLITSDSTTMGLFYISSGSIGGL